MDSTIHWHTHNDEIEFTAGHQILEFQQFLMKSLKQQLTYH